MRLANPFRLGMISAVAFLMVSPLTWGQAPPQPPQQLPPQQQDPGRTQPRQSDRGYLGVVILPGQQGALGAAIGDVTPDSPAAKAGLKKGDQIVKVSDKPVQDPQSLFQALDVKKPGDKVALGILRDNKEQTITVTLGERPARQSSAFPQQQPGAGLPPLRRPAFLGVQMLPLTPDIQQRLKIEAAAGVVVVDVLPNSPAAKAGLKRDDVVTAIDNQPVKDPMELRNAIQTAGPGKEVTLQVLRGTEKVSVKATLGQPSFGMFQPQGEGLMPAGGFGPIGDTNRRIQELEQRLEEVQKRIDALEKKSNHGPGK